MTKNYGRVMDEQQSAITRQAIALLAYRLATDTCRTEGRTKEKAVVENALRHATQLLARKRALSRRPGTDLAKAKTDPQLRDVLSVIWPGLAIVLGVQHPTDEYYAQFEKVRPNAQFRSGDLLYAKKDYPDESGKKDEELYIRLMAGETVVYLNNGARPGSFHVAAYGRVGLVETTSLLPVQFDPDAGYPNLAALCPEAFAEVVSEVSKGGPCKVPPPPPPPRRPRARNLRPAQRDTPLVEFHASLEHLLEHFDNGDQNLDLVDDSSEGVVIKPSRLDSHLMRTMERLDEGRFTHAMGQNIRAQFQSISPGELGDRELWVQVPEAGVHRTEPLDEAQDGHTTPRAASPKPRPALLGTIQVSWLLGVLEDLEEGEEIDWDMIPAAQPPPGPPPEIMLPLGLSQRAHASRPSGLRSSGPQPSRSPRSSVSPQSSPNLLSNLRLDGVAETEGAVNGDVPGLGISWPVGCPSPP
ncbi:hypothetical protein M011DRAFT_331527 [Sporormia fimetaria CBS 119925]|uniref:Uncharacterized protein n=1 Tax=Sporormia fimetaria CBS 119925 TaxID=1340428 RepID=A0A6A6VD91_9PLEO|nr:hypothetical protein M011DRAFT_331527 [Sporormia fimetaria CBS 119925]